MFYVVRYFGSAVNAYHADRDNAVNLLTVSFNASSDITDGRMAMGLAIDTVDNLKVGESAEWSDNVYTVRVGFCIVRYS